MLQILAALARLGELLTDFQYLWLKIAFKMFRKYPTAPLDINQDHTNSYYSTVTTAIFQTKEVFSNKQTLGDKTSVAMKASKWPT